MKTDLDFVKKKQDCCGCTACEAICPQNAIRMEPDREGFLYPISVQADCIACGLCQLVCPIQNRAEPNAHSVSGFNAERKQFVKDIPNAVTQSEKKHMQKYAVKNKDDQIRMASTSGAAYTALSDYVLENGGIVYGTVFDNDWEVRYERIANRTQRDRSRGAKYVQSQLNHTFSLVKEDLENGHLVLFVGQPCYVDGLLRFLKHSAKEKNGVLLTVDMVCHGAPSPLIWRDHVSMLKQKYPYPWKGYSFRDKRFGWRNVHNTLTFENGEEKHNTKEINAFTSLYFNGYISRPVCHRCSYTNLSRPGDLTIGDCWGIEESHSDFDDGLGISLVMVNTDAGAYLFEQVKEQFSIIPLAEGECVQPQLSQPADPSSQREQFWELYRKRGYGACIKKYVYTGKMKFLIRGVKNKLLKSKRARE